MIYYFVWSAIKQRPIVTSKVLLIGAWFVIGAALVGLAQIISKQEFGWGGSFVGVLAGAFLVALLMLGLQKLGLIYQ